MFQSFIFRHGQYQEVQLTGNKRCFGRSMTFKVKEAWEVKDVEKGCSWQEDTCAPSVWELTHMYTQKSIVTKYAFLPPGQKLATFSVKCQRVNIFGFVGCTASVTTTPLDRRDKSATIRDKWVWLCSNDIIYGHWYLSSVWSSPATTRDSPANAFLPPFQQVYTSDTTLFSYIFLWEMGRSLQCPHGTQVLHDPWIQWVAKDQGHRLEFASVRGHVSWVLVPQRTACKEPARRRGWGPSCLKKEEAESSRCWAGVLSV